MSVAQIGPVYVPQSAETSAAPAEFTRAETIVAPAIYAGFWLRAIAFLIDGFLTGIPFGFLAAAAPSKFFRTLDFNMLVQSPFSVLTPLAIVLMLGTTWLYGAAFESSAWQATPGKRLVRIRVTDLGGRRVSFARALFRNVGKQISSFLLLGYLLAGFTARKQALHDMLASCLVVRTR